jgi:hypothetical protein
MKIAIAGHTGFTGSYIRRYLTDKGHEIVPVSRIDFIQHNISFKLLDCDVIINFTGHPILCRWNEANMNKIIESRVGTTSSIVHTMSVITHPPKVLINASAIGIYSELPAQTEINFKASGGFLSEVVEQWESEAMKGIYSDTRVVIMRLGVVLGRNGGILKKLSPLFRIGLGAIIGNGKQKMSFVHIEDLARAVEHCINNPESQDVYNLTTPFPVTNREFSKALARALRKKVWLRIPKFILKIIFGRAASFLYESKDVIPRRLLDEGFQFQFPDIESSLNDIITAKKAGNT